MGTLPVFGVPESAGAARGIWRRCLCGVGVVLFLVVPGMVSVAWADDGSAAKSQSPYFFVNGGEPGMDALPLKSTEVDVRIHGVIADVSVVQHYRNEGQRTLEARYVFPGSIRAAVYAMNVRLGDRRIMAHIREKQRARIEYQQARNEGKTAALLEQHRPNVFQMQVANILPGDDVRVEMRYTELLVPQSGEYAFVFPTVVGPRYSSAQSVQQQAWAGQAYQPAGQPPASAFNIHVSVDAPLQVQELFSPSHQITRSRDAQQRLQVDLQPGSEPTANNRDFILNYRLAGDRVESGVMLYQAPDDENFFLAMVQPPKAVASDAIPARDYIFVLDISGSMHGFPLDTAKLLLRELLGTLRPSDSFNVMLFSGSNKMLSEDSVVATQANIQLALRTVDAYQGSGSTELVPALRRVYRQAKRAGVSRTVVVITDGYVSVESEAFALVRSHLSQANLFALGIGSSVNCHLIEGLARAGMGEPFIVTQKAQAPEVARRLRQMIDAPVLTQVKARFEGLEVYDVEPPQLPDVLAQRPVILYGKWRAPEGKAPEGKLVVEGMTAQGPYRHVLNFSGRVRLDAPALRYLWARNRIAELGDQIDFLGGNAALEAKVTGLGLRHSLLTPYTSFIAVDHVVRNAQPGEGVSVNQPLPMPEGVSDLAVGAGGIVPSTPEPGWAASSALIVSLLYMLQRRRRRSRPHRFTS